MAISPARRAAFDALLRIDNTNAYASELLHSSSFAKLSAADHALFTELVMGVLRWRGLLDKKIAQHSSQPIAKLDAEVLASIRLGAYQLLFLDRIPAHAAVNESVNLVRQARKSSAASFVNAVLRKIQKESKGPQSLDLAAADPAWLVERWNKNYGEPTARRISEYNQSSPATVIRASEAAVVQEIIREAIHLAAGRLVSSAYVVTEGNITRTKAFQERRISVQDEASQLVAMLVGKGKRILDCCAAPGGKSRLMAERNPDAMVVALELHPKRATLLRKLVANSNVQVSAADIRSVSFDADFDRVLADVPCSGTGTLAKNPDIKWRLKPEDLARLQAYQFEILEAAMKHVAPGGRIVYSTCSLEPEENSCVVEKALSSVSGFRLIDCGDELRQLQAAGELAWADPASLISGPYLRTIPGVHACEGFFAAILERK